MKAITLWQPWASFVTLGYKRIETRSWYSSYRGPLLIHAAARRPKTHTLIAYNGILRAHNLKVFEGYPPLGCVVAVCRLSDCRSQADPDLMVTDLERALGDWSPGRYAWLLDDIVPISPPVSWLGTQGLWNVPEELQAIVWGCVSVRDDLLGSSSNGT